MIGFAGSRGVASFSVKDYGLAVAEAWRSGLCAAKLERRTTGKTGALYGSAANTVRIKF